MECTHSTANIDQSNEAMDRNREVVNLLLARVLRRDALEKAVYSNFPCLIAVLW